MPSLKATNCEHASHLANLAPVERWHDGCVRIGFVSFAWSRMSTHERCFPAENTQSDSK